MKYPTQAAVGYDLFQFIISPLNDRVLPSFEVADSTVLESKAEPWVFLKITADNTQLEPTLRAEWINRDGRRIFQRTINGSELERRGGRTR